MQCMRCGLMMFLIHSRLEFCSGFSLYFLFQIPDFPTKNTMARLWLTIVNHSQPHWKTILPVVNHSQRQQVTMLGSVTIDKTVVNHSHSTMFHVINHVSGVVNHYCLLYVWQTEDLSIVCARNALLCDSGIRVLFMLLSNCVHPVDVRRDVAVGGRCRASTYCAVSTSA